MKVDYILNQYSKLSKYLLLFLEYEKYEKEVELIKKFLKPKAKILDIGCGIGVHSILLSKHNFYVKGIDICPEMIEIAKKVKIKNSANCSFKIMDMRKMSLKEKFDAGLFFHSFYYLITDKDINDTISNLKKCLKRNGKVIIFNFSFFHAILNKSFKKRYVLRGEKNRIKRKIVITHNIKGKIVYATEKHRYIHKDKKAVEEFTAKCIYRIFSPDEIIQIFNKHHFEILEFTMPLKNYILIVFEYRPESSFQN